MSFYRFVLLPISCYLIGVYNQIKNDEKIDDLIKATMNNTS